MSAKFKFVKSTQKGEKSTEIVQKSKDKRYGKKLMVLAIMTGRGVLPLQFIPPKVKINGKYYIDHVLIPLVSKWLPKLYPEGLDRVFVHHDAAPAHICSEAEKIMKKLSDSTKITFISKQDIPIKSPDASPLDFFGFGYLKQQLTQHKVKTLDDLRRTANRIWSGIPSELVLKVFRSWRRRLYLIDKNQGKHIEHVQKLHRKPLANYNQ